MDHSTIAEPHRLSRRALAAAVAGLALPAGQAADGRRAKGRKTVRKTFSNGRTITIPVLGSADPYPAQIRVRGFKRARVTDVNVVLDGITHYYLPDLDFMLQAPNGRKAIILSDAGPAQPVADLTLTLDDQVVVPVPVTVPIPRLIGLDAGTYHPTDYGDAGTDFLDASKPGPTKNITLATFNGIDPNGVWKLWIYDDTSPDVTSPGKLTRGWKLIITATERR